MVQRTGCEDRQDITYISELSFDDTDMQAYGSERLLDSLNRNKDLSLSEMLYAVKEDIDSFAGEADQFDDITMLGFKYV